MTGSQRRPTSPCNQHHVSSICIASLLFCAALPAADQLELRNGSHVEGTLLSSSAEGCVFFDARGQTTLYKDAVVSQLAAGDATPRWARVPGKDASRVLRIKSLEGHMLRCLDEQGKAIELPVGKEHTLEFYAAASPARQLRVPHVKQKPDYCGEACIEMVTTYFGEPVSQDRFNELAKLKTARGVYGEELVRVVDLVLKRETAGRAGRACRTATDRLWDRAGLVRAISEGRPVLLGFWANPERKTNEDHWAFDHFVLLIGYDLAKGIFLINDPGDNDGKAREIPFDRFAKHRENKFGGLFHIEFPPWRTWTIGERKVRAQFLRLDDQQAALRASNGAETTIELKQLSEDDRKAIEQMNAK